MAVDTEILIKSLSPVLRRVRLDVSAIKIADGSSRWVREPVTKERLVTHLSGGTPRGVCPIREGESTTMLGLFDLDSHGGETPWDEMAKVARELMDALELDGMRPVAWRSSGGKGIHIYLLWDEPQDAYSVRAYMSDVLAMLGYRNGAKGVVNKQIEVFPKQDSVGQGEYGNQFILPLAGKSEPLDPLMDLMPMGREWATQVEWASSLPVPRRSREVALVTQAGDRAPDDLSRVRNALFAIPNSSREDGPDYDRWRDLAFAVHEATGGSEEGRELFAAWSRQNPIFDEKFFEERVWPYIRSGENRGNAITRGTLYAQAAGAGWTDTTGVDADGFEDVTDTDIEHVTGVAKKRALEKYEAKDDWKKAISDAKDEFDLRERVCAGISRDQKLNDVDREILAEALKAAFANIGSKLPIAVCRKLVAPMRAVRRDDHLPKWLQGWVYVTDDDRFYFLDTGERLTMQGFNGRFNRELMNEDGEISKSASWIALEDYKVETVARLMYLPWAASTFTYEGVQCANLFRPASLPEKAESYTPQGRKVIERFKSHIMLLTGGRKDVADVLFNWMAYNVQNPGRKIRWAPIIKGIQGDGKTLIKQTLAAVLGTSNVKDISPKVLGTDFTSWAHGACVGVLEEIRLTGHSRHDIYNALKPYITNDTVTIHAKGQDEFNTSNTMNYIAFTNSADALPLDDGDRRFFVVFTPFVEKDDLRKAVGDVDAYFSSLYEGIQSHPGELRKWLLEYPIADSFKPNGVAPMTNEKGSMIALSSSNEEDVARSAIETGGPGIGKSVLVSQYLTRALREIDSEIELKTSEVSRLLTKMGWIKVSKPIKWRGTTCRVWVKGVSSEEPEALRTALDSTLETSDGGVIETEIF